MMRVVLAVSLLQVVAATEVPTWACALAARPHLLGNSTAEEDQLRLDEQEAAGGASAADERAVAQQVQAVTATSLGGVLQAAAGDVLVVFYAPWCPHCQTFVMRDHTGNPDNAPLEKLNREFLQLKNGPVAVKFDTDASGVPSDFQVQYIPTIYLAKKDGSKALFEGNPDDLAGLKSWAVNGGATPMTVMQVKSSLRSASPIDWGSMNDALNVMTGKPTTSQLSTLAVKKAAAEKKEQRRKALADAEARAESVSPLSKLSLDTTLEDVAPTFANFLK